MQRAERDAAWASPRIVPLGDSAVLVRFADSVSDAANRAALAFARRLETRTIPGVLEVAPNLVSVLLRYDPREIGFQLLSGEIGLVTSAEPDASPSTGEIHEISVAFDGPDLPEIAAALSMTVGAFIAAHNATDLRVLATGFAPGFLYCGFHPKSLHLPRRDTVRAKVEAGTVLFAAGQTAVTATPIPTGWSVIGHTDFRNFDAASQPPLRLVSGDSVRFTAAR